MAQKISVCPVPSDVAPDGRGYGFADGAGEYTCFEYFSFGVRNREGNNDVKQKGCDAIVFLLTAGFDADAVRRDIFTLADDGYHAQHA